VDVLRALSLKRELLPYPTWRSATGHSTMYIILVFSNSSAFGLPVALFGIYT